MTNQLVPHARSGPATALHAVGITLSAGPSEPIVILPAVFSSTRHMKAPFETTAQPDRQVTATLQAGHTYFYLSMTLRTQVTSWLTLTPPSPRAARHVTAAISNVKARTARRWTAPPGAVVD